jgi:hypothetical protein
MRVKVQLRREGGAYCPPYGKGDTAIGQLSLMHRDASGRKVACPAPGGAERAWPDLYEPRLAAWGGNEFKFLGYERLDRAWVMQEWECEVL